MEANLSIIELITRASWLVQLVMLLLLFASVFSWVLIFKKRVELKNINRRSNLFEERFWSGGDLQALHQEVSAIRKHAAGMELVFRAGFKEFMRATKQKGVTPAVVTETSQRAMNAAIGREQDEMELHLPMLATIGSTSPYVGLFGTVWGIMNSFTALGNAQQATLAMVAPGIAEALIATALGLFAAIPAVIAYNRYSSEIERLVNRYETFSDEFTNILQRQAYSDAQ